MNATSRELVLIVSTMRSGSTLLKALLAEAPDISQLNEVNFQKYRELSDPASIWELAPQRIVLLKRPAWYHEVECYPRLPRYLDYKLIVLVRDVYETVESLRRMTFGRAQAMVGMFVDHWLAQRYWLGVTTHLAQLADGSPSNIRMVRYEDLVNAPVEVTQELFRFLESSMRHGVQQYRSPSNNPWRWGRDDNSTALRSLQVQPGRVRARTNRRLLRILEESTPIRELRRKLGYL